MKIISAKFIKSSKTVYSCPKSKYLEYAFTGRSNVGKSTLINILSRSKLAITSSTPGRTKLINHFLINNTFSLVDLPGYGYMNVSKDKTYDIQKNIFNYILIRKNLIALFILIDLSLPPQYIDLMFIKWLKKHNYSFNIIFTKINKVKKNIKLKNIEIFRNTLLEMFNIALFYLEISLYNNEIQRQNILMYIDYLNRNFSKIYIKKY